MLRSDRILHLVCLVSVFVLGGAPPLHGEAFQRRVFEAPRELHLDLNLGDCRIEKSGDGKVYVELVQAYPEGVFTPSFEMKGSRLCLGERFTDDRRSGKSQWRIAVPDGLCVAYASQWGSLSIDGVRLDIEGTTGMGSIRLKQVSGAISLSTGTGRIEADGASGDLVLKSGTGDVKARACRLDRRGRFESGTGDVDITLPSGRGYELDLASGMGRARLRLLGQAPEGYFELLSTDERGHLRCGWPFDREERFTDARGHCTRKSFTRGGAGTRIVLTVGCGKAEVLP